MPTGTEADRCDQCGIQHLYDYNCSWDLHGEADSFKSRCAACETPIESNAPRVGDKYGNLYCDAECMAEGLSILLARNAEGPEGDAK